MACGHIWSKSQPTPATPSSKNQGCLSQYPCTSYKMSAARMLQHLREWGRHYSFNHLMSQEAFQAVPEGAQHGYVSDFLGYPLLCASHMCVLCTGHTTWEKCSVSDKSDWIIRQDNLHLTEVSKEILLENVLVSSSVFCTVR